MRLRAGVKVKVWGAMLGVSVVLVPCNWDLSLRIAATRLGSVRVRVGANVPGQCSVLPHASPSL